MENYYADLNLEMTPREEFISDEYLTEDDYRWHVSIMLPWKMFADKRLHAEDIRLWVAHQLSRYTDFYHTGEALDMDEKQVDASIERLKKVKLLKDGKKKGESVLKITSACGVYGGGLNGIAL